MEKIQIIYPIFPLVFLTLFSLAHYNRVFSREYKNNNIKSEWFRLYKGELPESAIKVREHYKNLFELPIIFFLLLTGFINSFQAFNHILVMKTSSAGETMYVVTIEIFDHFWDRVKFGYAAAEGVILFILLNILAISQYVIFRKRLSYD